MLVQKCRNKSYILYQGVFFCVTQPGVTRFILFHGCFMCSQYANMARVIVTACLHFCLHRWKLPKLASFREKTAIHRCRQSDANKLAQNHHHLCVFSKYFKPCFLISDRFRQFYFSVKPGFRNYKIILIKITFLTCDLQAKRKIQCLFAQFTSDFTFVYKTWNK